MNAALVLLGLSLVLFGGCDDTACSPCPRGSVASDPAKVCSACVPVPDGGQDADAASEGPPCSSNERPEGDYPFLCFAGGPGICSDFGRPPVCMGGRWQCSGFSSRGDQCRCFAPSPGGSCSCTEAGWHCLPDAGADAMDAGDAHSIDTPTLF